MSTTLIFCRQLDDINPQTFITEDVTSLHETCWFSIPIDVRVRVFLMHVSCVVAWSRVRRCGRRARPGRTPAPRTTWTITSRPNISPGPRMDRLLDETHRQTGTRTYIYIVYMYDTFQMEEVSVSPPVAPSLVTSAAASLASIASVWRGWTK